jgi:hypothetical protein
MKKVTSREYQCRLLLSRFPNGEGDISALFDALHQLDPRVCFDGSMPDVLQFEQYLLDTPSQAFAEAHVKLRVRTMPSWTSCTQKVVSRDLYYVRHANVDATDPDAETKLEENIYPYHAMWAAQSTTRHRKPQRFAHVRDWCELFPSAAAVALKPTVLQRGPSWFFTTYSELLCDFDGDRCKATLEFKYGDEARTELRVVELAWKHLAKEANFDPRTVRLMRHYLARLSQSGWVDLDAALLRSKLESY